MPSESKIKAGNVLDIENVRQDKTLLERWIFSDIGFAPDKRSCGVAVGNHTGKEVKFADLVAIVVKVVKEPGEPLNLLLESPLSIAFTQDGNPWPRNFEWSTKSKNNQLPKWFKDRLGSDHKGWYLRAGASTKAGAERLVWKLHRCKPQREVLLFEGFAPLKGTKHKEVAERLRDAVTGETGSPIVSPDKIVDGQSKVDLWPITGISGWDSDEPPGCSTIPPVVWVP